MHHGPFGGTVCSFAVDTRTGYPMLPGRKRGTLPRCSLAGTHRPFRLKKP